MTGLGVPQRDLRVPNHELPNRTGLTDLRAIDEEDELVHAVGGIGLPITGFALPGGEIAEIWVGALDVGAFREFAAEHFGVVA